MVPGFINDQPEIEEYRTTQSAVFINKKKETSHIRSEKWKRSSGKENKNVSTNLNKGPAIGQRNTHMHVTIDIKPLVQPLPLDTTRNPPKIGGQSRLPITATVPRNPQRKVFQLSPHQVHLRHPEES